MQIINMAAEEIGERGGGRGGGGGGGVRGSALPVLQYFKLHGYQTVKWKQYQDIGATPSMYNQNQMLCNEPLLPLCKLRAHKIHKNNHDG